MATRAPKISCRCVCVCGFRASVGFSALTGLGLLIGPKTSLIVLLFRVSTFIGLNRGLGL